MLSIIDYQPKESRGIRTMIAHMALAGFCKCLTTFLCKYFGTIWILLTNALALFCQVNRVA